jgi:protein-disulfide isomerase
MNRKVAFAVLATVGVVASAAGLARLLPAPIPAAKSAGKAPAAPTVPVQGAPSPSQMVDDPKAVYRVLIDGAPVRGSIDAPVTIVEASDFECPFCKRAVPTMKRIAETYGDKVRFAFLHSPLAMHPNAIPAALLAEEARAQGGDAKFWAAHDKLLELSALDRASLERAALDLRLDVVKVKAALDEKAHLERIQKDRGFLMGLGARGTPTFFVNGRKIVGAVPYETFQAVIDEELARATALQKEGVKASSLYARLVEKGATTEQLIPAPAKPAAEAQGPGAAGKITVRADDPAKGPTLAPVTVVLFSDFQCPFCAKVGPTLKQIEAAYPRDVRVVWKHLPLPFHSSAVPAAKAAEAARAQGKFWELHDRLFAAQSALNDAAFVAYAKELRLDLAKFQKDLASEGAAKRIAEDAALAAASGATGTPTLFVNCRKVVGAQPFEAFRAVIDEELAKAKGKTIDAGWYDRACAANAQAVAQAARPAAVAVRPDDPARGRADAKVTVVEFSDFQCPFCSRAVPAVKELEKEFGAEVRVVWKHLPLSFHPNAMPAAIAAEAARQQGKFWEMHDKLFAGQQSLSEASYLGFAAELGLDAGRFRKALGDPATRARVEEDARAAAAAGVTGTPTFLVNGERVVGAVGLKDAIRRHLETARGSKG